MTQEEKITYLDISMRVCGFNFKPEHLDLIITMFEAILEKKGETDLKDIAKIQVQVNDRHKVIEQPNPKSNGN